MADQNIQAIQQALQLCGCNPGKIDGIMGKNTLEAIRDFQKRCGIDVDGDVGPITRSNFGEKLGEVAMQAQQLKGYFEGGGVSVEDQL